MNYHELRRFLLDYLKYEYMEGNGNFQFQAAQGVILNFAKNKGFLSNNENFSDEEWDEILDILNSFLIEGILRWGYNIHNASPPFMGVTSYGRQILSTNEPNPHDPDGYMMRLYEEVPDLDANTKMYLLESLNTFRKNSFMSSAVMLGVAAESVFNVMYDSLLDSVQSEKIKKSLEKLRNSAKTKQRIDLLRDILLITYKKKIPRNVADGFESKTDPLFNLIRQIRNDVGHPTGINIDKMTQYVNLQLFIPYIVTAHELIEFLNENKL